MKAVWSYLPRVFHYLRPYWKLAATSGLITLLLALFSLAAPWPLKILIDHVLEQHPMPPALAQLLGPLGADLTALMLVTVIAGLLITLIDNAFNVLNNYLQTRLEQRMILDFRSELFQHVQRLSLTFHDSRRTGDFMARINLQSSAVGNILMTIPPLAQSVITLVGMFWIASQIHLGLALLSLTVVPFLYCSIGFYAHRIQPELQQVKTLEGQSLSIVHEAVAMLRVIVAFGREPHEYRRFRSQGEQAVDARVKVTVRQTLFSLVVNTTTAAGTALVLGFGASQVMHGRLTVGQLLVIMSYIASVYTPLEAITSTVGSLQEQSVNLQRVFELLDTKPEIVDQPGAVAIERAKGRVVFDHVGFSYPKRAGTLKDITFEVQAGQAVAIVGPTGAGKSTLVSLVPRFYDPQRGRILLDGQDIRALTVKSLREQISLVLQEPLLFSGTIAENIRYGRLEAGMEEVMEAARAANAHEFIMALPKQYQTELGERGSQLSGGERQRIAVARAFMKDTPILILDEPTSSIDSKTEAVILEALERLMLGRTTFMIAHRLSTIRNVDLILVIHHGQLIEQGKHAELLARGGLYAQLSEMQTIKARQKPLPLTSPVVQPI